MIEYNKNNPLRVVTLCSGYDSQCLGFERLKKLFPDFEYDLVAWSEFDPASNKPIDEQPAVIAHNALFPQWKDRNLGDMTKIDWEKVGDFDMLFYSTPCQSVSQAGLQHGFAEGSGTRSSIIWNVRDALRIKKPKYACLENVSAMVTEKFLPMFNLWRDEVYKLGYDNYAQVLNATDFNIAQNRERIFLVSIYSPNHDSQFFFPEPVKRTKTIADVLEDKVDKCYYLNPVKVNEFVKENKAKIQEYARKGVGEIEKMPKELQEYVDSCFEKYDNESGNESQEPISTEYREQTIEDITDFCNSESERE